MIRYSKIIFTLTSIVVMLWVLPWFYHFVTTTPHGNPFTLYSSVIRDFAYVDYDEEKGVQYRDRKGNVYSDQQYDSIIPLFFYRQLIADGRLPDSLHGVKLTPHKIGINNFSYRFSASDQNKRMPKLYPLLEAMSGRVDLEMPEDVFRLTDRIEFIDMGTNSINEEKSKRFTQAMLKKGFRFPVGSIGGNPTTRKEYDEGYFLTDANNRLFHLKQLKGRPYFRPVELPEGVVVKQIFVREFMHKKFYALLCDQNNQCWVVSTDSYKLYPLPIEEYDPTRHNIQIIGDLFHWTVSIDRADGEHIYAINARDYTLVDTMFYPAQEDRATQIGRYLFPLEISFTSYDDQYVQPRIEAFSAKALWLPILVIAWFASRMIRKKRGVKRL